MLGTLEVATRWFYADIGSTGDNTSYFARRWKAQHEGGRNSLGFREGEITAKAEGVTRIVVVGDSFTYGQGVNRQERYTERLDSALGPQIEILNFGDPGANYDTHLANMELALEIAKPDVVVLQWLFNDVQPADERGPGPMNLAGPFHRFIQPYSALYFVLNLGFKQLQTDLGLAPSTNYFDKFADPASIPAVAAQARLEAVLDMPAAADLPYGMILWPALYNLRFTFDEALFNQVLAVCAERDISCLDLRPALAAAPTDASLMVNSYDAHPSKLAHQLAAEAALPWLKELIDPLFPR
jgi:lysophospholipase L1-like esterase